MFDISPMLSQSFSTFATAKNADPITRIIQRALQGYTGENRPTVEIHGNGSNKEVWLKGGSYAARQYVEDEFIRANKFDGVKNQPTSKVIMIK